MNTLSSSKEIPELSFENADVPNYFFFFFFFLQTEDDKQTVTFFSMCRNEAL